MPAVNGHKVFASSHIFLLVGLKGCRCEQIFALLVGFMIGAAVFKVVTVVALAELRTRHSRLEALAVVLLAFSLATVATLEVDFSAV